MTEIVRVLLLAADPPSRGLVIQALDASSTRTTVVTSPAEARALLNADRYGLVIVTNLGVSPWLAMDVVPEDHPYEAMFISGNWDDQITHECQRRRLHPVRVPCDLTVLREEISQMVSKARRAALDPAATRQEVSANRDAGLEVLDFVKASMQIDDCWSVQGTRGFTWWGHRLAQRVSAGPVRDSHGFGVARLSAETDLLRNVPSTRQTAQRIAVLNQHASLNAFIWDPDARRIRLRCSAGVHAETFGTVKHLFMGAVSLQAADAHIKVDGLAKLLGGEPDTSSHPQSGPRPDLDGMLNVIEQLYVPEGRKPAPFTPSDFAQAARLEPAPWLEVSNGGAKLRARMRAERYPSGTGILFATTMQPHPQLGSGLFMLLTIPTSVDPDVALPLCHQLNLAEAHAREIPYCFGAWCLQPAGNQGLAYVMFVPTAVCRPNLIEAMSVQMAARAAWARQQLDEGRQDIRAYASAVKASEPTTRDQAPSHPQPSTRVSPANKTAENVSRHVTHRSKKLPLDAIITAGLGVIALVLAVLTQPGMVESIRAGVLIGVLAVLALNNRRTGLIPDRITLPVLGIGLLTSPVAQDLGPVSALLGVVVGGGIMLILALITQRIGGGVLKMAAMIGAFLGWYLTLVAIALSFIIGATIWARMQLGRRQAGGPLGFAPYLAIAATMTVFIGDRIIGWYLR